MLLSFQGIFSLQKTGTSRSKQQQDFYPPSGWYQRAVYPTCFSYVAEKPPLHAIRMSLSCSTTSILVWRCACSVTSSATRRRSWCAVVAVLPTTHSAWIPLGSTRPQMTGGAPSASRKSTTDPQKCTALSRQRRSTL